jgi:hypothetical protein
MVMVRTYARPEILTSALVVYTFLFVLWLFAIDWRVRLEPGADQRFVSASGWPTRPMLVGFVWTVLLVAGTIAALRAPRALGAWCLAVMTACALTLWLFIPPWFRGMGIVGLSASEFIDAFLLIGGIFPGGQGTLALLGACVGLASLAAFRALVR